MKTPAEQKRPSVGLRDALAHRRDFIQLVLLGVILALGTNLVAGDLFVRLGRWSWASPLLGSAFIFGCLVYLSRLVFGVRKISASYAAAVVFHPEQCEVIPVRQYFFSQRLHEALDAAFVENGALSSYWKQQPLFPGRKPRRDRSPDSKKVSYIAITRSTVDTGERSKSEPKSWPILREATEFVILQALSSHLSTYFQEYSDDDKYIKEYKREDVPSLLFDNRIVSLLSTPLENRALFVDSDFATNPPPGEEVFMVKGSDGSLYRRFNLVLPVNTTISRPAPGVLVLENQRLRLELKIVFLGFELVLPREMARFYLGVDWDAVRVARVNVEVNAVVKRWSLLRASGWNYYQWIDSYIEKLDEFASWDRFLRQIDWDALSAGIYVRHMERLLLRGQAAAALTPKKDGEAGQPEEGREEDTQERPPSGQ